ncbi:hypothetical protein [Limosilactobacillus kribbianus]|uniref:hypothetical protein n=1 Tax=Limosilactobacillus kribbianus TaxID=2982695 RepID=UPI0022645327|nr:hypothetical protein [Limosilactobacillus kribbianus]
MKYEMDLIDAKDEGVAIGVKKGLKNGEAIGLKKGRDEQQTKDIILMVKVLKSNQISDEKIEHDLMSNYGLSRQEAQKYMQ